MPNRFKFAAEGALAGLAGTAALQALVFPAEKYLPDFHPPQSDDPAAFLLWQGGKMLPRKAWLKIPPAASVAAGFALSFIYGATFGTFYGTLRKTKARLLLDGATLGLITWAVGYLGWLPLTKLIPSPHKQSPKQFAGPIIEHIAYGIATVAAYQLLNKKW